MPLKVLGYKAFFFLPWFPFRPVMVFFIAHLLLWGKSTDPHRHSLSSSMTHCMLSPPPFSGQTSCPWARGGEVEAGISLPAGLLPPPNVGSQHTRVWPPLLQETLSIWLGDKP